GRRQPLAPLPPRDVLRASCPLAQRRNQLAAAAHARAQDLRAEPAGDARELGVMNLRVGGGRAREACARVIEAFARQRERRLGAKSSWAVGSARIAARNSVRRAS